MRPVGLGKRILGSKKPLGSRTMPFTLGIFFECIRDRNRSVAQVLSVHGFNGGIRSLKAGEIDEGESFRVATLRVSHNFRRLENHSECRECVVEQLLVYFWVQVAYEDICSNVEVLLMGRCL